MNKKKLFIAINQSVAQNNCLYRILKNKTKKNQMKIIRISMHATYSLNID